MITTQLDLRVYVLVASVTSTENGGTARTAASSGSGSTGSSISSSSSKLRVFLYDDGLVRLVAITLQSTSYTPYFMHIHIHLTSCTIYHASCSIKPYAPMHHAPMHHVS